MGIIFWKQLLLETVPIGHSMEEYWKGLWERTLGNNYICGKYPLVDSSNIFRSSLSHISFSFILKAKPILENYGRLKTALRGNGINRRTKKKQYILLSSNKCKFMFNRQNKSNHEMIDYFCCRYTIFFIFPLFFPHLL